MEIEILEVVREKGEAVAVYQRIGNVEICWVRKGEGETVEAISRVKESQILDSAQIYLPRPVWEKAFKQAWAILHHRQRRKNPRRKNPSQLELF